MEGTCLCPGLPVNNQHAWSCAVAGKFPAENRGRAWYVDPADVPLIAATLVRIYRPRGKI
jgi:hypothetical protein